ncbi:hypothetical protein JCM1841_001252 [Sporobolomyces salmonicolor]
MRVEEGFQQTPLELPLAYTGDPALQSLLERELPRPVFEQVREELTSFEQRLAGPIRALASSINTAPHSVEPVLTQYDQWGRRVDTLHTYEGWRALKGVAAEEGLVAIAMERNEGEHSRVRSFAKSYLFLPDSLYVGCPISMTDGAARVLELSGTEAMKKAYIPKLCSRDPAEAYCGAQWMTERPGGSDVSLTETVARPVQASRTPQSGDAFVLDGFKWFSSATDGDITLALARTGDPGSGSKGLSLFLIKLRDDEGNTNGIYVHRLKKKFGTKALPTAELSLSNCIGHLVGPLGSGVRTISTVLNITRLHSAMSCVSALRRCLVLAKSFAAVRHIAGATNNLLIDNGMHTSVLAGSELVHRALLHFCFGTIHLLGRSEALVDGRFGQDEKWRLRLMTPVVKSFSAELSTTEMPRLMEALGGQGYMLENEFGRLIADANVERIWEGTTSVLALDVVRVILQSKGAAVEHFSTWIRSILSTVPDALQLNSSRRTLEDRLKALSTVTARFRDPSRSADGRLARPVLFHLGYLASATHLIEHAVWSWKMRKAEAQADRWIAHQWVDYAGARETSKVLEGLLDEEPHDAQATRRLERSIVYGDEVNRAKL